MGDAENTPDEASADSSYTMLDFIRNYLAAYAFVTGLLAVLFAVLSFGALAMGHFSPLLLGIAAYTVACAIGMIRSHSGLRSGDAEAPRRTRITLLATTPASVLLGAIGLWFAIPAANGIVTRTAYGGFAYLITIVGGMTFLGAVTNLFLLLRLLFNRDLDALAWAHREEDLEVGMNFVEDERED